MHSVFNKRGAFFIMRKTLTHTIKWLTVATTLLLLVQLHLYVASTDVQSGESKPIQTDENSAADEPLIVSIDQLLPPFVNGEGPGVRPVEPPVGQTTRILSDNDEFRLAHSCQLIAQQLAHSRIAYLLHLTQREQAGFYLYELCKLLI